MKQKTKLALKLFILSISLISAAALYAPKAAYAADSPFTISQICTPDNSAAGSGYNLGRCVNNIYLFSIILSGFVGVLMFIFAGYLYIQGSAEDVEQANSIMGTTLLGMAILFGTFLILNTIDPALTKIPSISAPAVNCSGGGIFNDCSALPQNNPNIKNPFGVQNANADTTNAAANPNEGAPVDPNASFVRFNQSASPWGSQSYGSCPSSDGPGTVSSSGCGPAALAEIFAWYYKQGSTTINPDITSKYHISSAADINPGTIAQIAADKGLRACGQGSSHEIGVQLAPLFGLKATPVTDFSQVQTALQSHIPVLVAVGGPSYFTNGGHFIVLYGMPDSGHVLIADSGPRNRTIATVQTLTDAANYYWVIKP